MGKSDDLSSFGEFSKHTSSHTLFREDADIGKIDFLMLCAKVQMLIVASRLHHDVFLFINSTCMVLLMLNKNNSTFIILFTA